MCESRETFHQNKRILRRQEGQENKQTFLSIMKRFSNYLYFVTLPEQNLKNRCFYLGGKRASTS